MIATESTEQPMNTAFPLPVASSMASENLALPYKRAQSKKGRSKVLNKSRMASFVAPCITRKVALKWAPPTSTKKNRETDAQFLRVFSTT